MIPELEAAIATIRERSALVPQVGLILGSGCGELVGALEQSAAIDYADIPGFATATAPSHAGRLHLGLLAGTRVAVMEGRLHLYEGHAPQAIAFPVRVLAGLGARTLVLTNAAGGLDESYEPGDLMLLEDHLSLPNLAGLDPLRGQEALAHGERFQTLNGAYDRELLELAYDCAGAAGLRCHRGCYAFVVGPSFETPAEVRLLRGIGAQAVGMSTVPEVITARHAGMRVLAISVITNCAVTDIQSAKKTNVEEVWETMDQVRPRLRLLLETVLQKLQSSTGDL